MSGKKQDPLKRFWKKVNKTDTCWLWTGCVSKSGYGNFGLNNGQIMPHRFSWQIFNGEIPKGLLVCHKCDNRICVNPEHLFLGTHSDNSKDMAAKGRSLKAERNPMRIHPELHVRGEAHPMSKLTNQQVIEIRQLSSNGLSQRQIAKQFNVYRSTIGRILKGEKWKHLI